MQEAIKRLLIFRKNFNRAGLFKKENLDMYKIKDWLYKNRKKARNFMNMNARYIFLKNIKEKLKEVQEFL